MSDPKQQQKQLLKWAIISSPLIGLYNILPIMMMIVLLADFDPAILALREEGWIFVGAIFFITTSIFILWLMNLFLLKRWKSKRGLFGLKSCNSRYTLSFSITLITVLILHSLVRPLRPISIPNIGLFALYPLLAGLFHNTIILLLMGLNESQHQRQALVSEKAQLKISQLHTEQEQLKQQIHPHFLFNALSTLKIFIRNDQEKADHYIKNLSDYLRQSIDLGRKNLVSVREDLAFLDNYISLQKVRFGENVRLINHLTDETLTEYEVPIFTFQLLAENAIKHNAFNVSKPLIMEIKLNEKEEITFENNRLTKVTLVESTGFGLNNLSQRFRLFSSKDLVIDRQDLSFMVTLPIIQS